MTWYAAGATVGHDVRIGYVTRRVYEARLLETPSGTLDACTHQHYTRERAARCAAKLAQRRNREAAA